MQTVTCLALKACLKVYCIMRRQRALRAVTHFQPSMSPIKAEQDLINELCNKGYVQDQSRC